MYRIMGRNRQVRERRSQRRHPHYEKPQLVATAPNQLWSWDITKLLGPAKWTYFYLYVILDIFSRYVVGWTLARAENAEIAKHMSKAELMKLCDPANYLGQAGEMVDRVLELRGKA